MPKLLKVGLVVLGLYLVANVALAVIGAAFLASGGTPETAHDAGYAAGSAAAAWVADNVLWVLGAVALLVVLVRRH